MYSGRRNHEMQKRRRMWQARTADIHNIIRQCSIGNFMDFSKLETLACLGPNEEERVYQTIARTLGISDDDALRLFIKWQDNA